MKFLLLHTCFLLLVIGNGQCSDIDGSNRLVRILHALTEGLKYMDGRVNDINLDAVFCVRYVQEQLHAYLTHVSQEFRPFRKWVKFLRNKAKRIADEGKRQVYLNDPVYASDFGYYMDESSQFAWYPTRSTSLLLVEPRETCASLDQSMNEAVLYTCFKKINRNSTRRCHVSPACMEQTVKRNQSDYILTHQHLYWRFLENIGCMNRIPDELELRLCSNVLRDAKLIARAQYPLGRRDLFMEQIGFCGLRGFSDFCEPEWIEQILEWQQDSGCYNDYVDYTCSDNLQPDSPVRVKRTEKLFTDNCLSHETGVALLAMTASLRFEAERHLQAKNVNENDLKNMLM